jgi:preprotein translocase subunit SecD
MLYFSRWKAAAILGVCLLGLLLSVPNLVPRSALPSWLPAPRVSLGLDLRGGSYLLLEVDLSAAARERLESLVDAARTKLRDARVQYVDLGSQPAERRMSVRVRDPAQAEAAARAIRELATPVAVGGGAATRRPDLAVTAAPDGAVTATLTDAALRAKAAGAVEQSIEIVRRRVDETGIAEALIAREGQNRILVQLPGVQDPNRTKALLGRTARMTFHLLGATADPGAATPPPPGVQLLPGDHPGERYAVRRQVALDGADLTDARAG